MGLFSKKQSKELPKFPRLPEKPSFPEYRIQVPTPEPFRMKLPEIRPMEEEEEVGIPIRRPQMPLRILPPEEIAPTLQPQGSQPLFVKIEKYRAAIGYLNEIKQRLAEAEETLSKLNAIKVRETDELARWEAEVRNIKEKLMAMDKNLFEV